MAAGIRPKKHLGQHFLADQNIAKKIAGSISHNQGYLLEIGPGTGSLTQFLIETWGEKLWLVEIDPDAIGSLHHSFPALVPRIVEGNFLTLDLSALLNHDKLNIIGNFPYNISSQILFRVIAMRRQVIQLAGMFQDEVAKRICSPPGNKGYGILSVLVQAYFETEYLFSVPPNVFIPPPAVNSGVIRLVTKQDFELRCSDVFFKTVVKTAFNQRRKKLSNALSGMASKADIGAPYAEMRAEQLSWRDFEELACRISGK